MENLRVRMQPTLGKRYFMSLTLVLLAIVAGILSQELVLWAQNLTSFEGVGWIILPLAKFSLDIGQFWTMVALWFMLIAFAAVIYLSIAGLWRAAITVWRFISRPKRTAGS
jgi:hypothetical protein